MNILLTNDDGINALGIQTLKKALLKEGHNIVIIAPTNNQSGSSHRMSFYKNMKLTKIDEYDNLVEYSLSGSPSDCVKLGLSYLYKDQIDLVISGVNDLPNTGTDILYSGTFNGALEGIFNNVRSIAISATEDAFINSAVEFLIRNLDSLYNNFFTLPYAININVPNTLDKIKGVKICPVGEKRYTDLYKVTDTEDENVKEYFLYGDEIPQKQNPSGCDVEMLNDGYITITPTKIDMLNDYKYCNKLKEIKLK